MAILHMLLHAAHDLLYNALLGADLGAGNEAAEVVHIQQGADLKQTAEHGRGLGNSAAADIARQVGGEEPMVKLELVFLKPLHKLLGAETLVALGGGGVHQQAVAGGRAERIDDVDIAFREAFLDNERSVTGGVYGAGDTRGEADVDNIKPLFEEL